MKIKQIRYHRQNGILDFVFDTSASSPCSLSAEYLRVFSPSAELHRHSANRKLEYGKKNIKITSIEKVGNYAIKLIFTDGHSTGIYSWDYIYNLCKNKDINWLQYLKDLENNGLSRESAEPKLNIIAKSSDDL